MFRPVVYFTAAAATLCLVFQRDGVIDLSEVRNAMVKSTGSIEMGHPCIRSKIIFFFFLYILFYLT